MSLPNESPLQKLQFYVTAPYTCGYLPKQLSQSLIATPQHLVSSQVYSNLIQQGFRRSGKFAYRPYCEFCQACVPTRLVLQDFSPNRSQQRAFKQHRNLQAKILPLAFHAEHFALYQRYQQARHPDEKSTDAAQAAEQYDQFLCQSNIESRMVAFFDETDLLKAVSVVDIVQDGISAVYTFYDPEDKASYGTFAVMWLAEWCKTLSLPYLYLGYWIENSQKMAYKQHFKPQQRLIAGEWQMAD